MITIPVIKENPERNEKIMEKITESNKRFFNRIEEQEKCKQQEEPDFKE
jgi:hypothetical protein